MRRADLIGMSEKEKWRSERMAIFKYLMAKDFP